MVESQRKQGFSDSSPVIWEISVSLSNRGNRSDVQIIFQTTDPVAWEREVSLGGWEMEYICAILITNSLLSVSSFSNSLNFAVLINRRNVLNTGLSQPLLTFTKARLLDFTRYASKIELLIDSFYNL